MSPYVTFPVAFPYEARIRLAGRRKSEDAVLRGETAVQVRDVSYREAPIALRIVRPFGWPGGAQRDLRTPIRSFEGALWAPFRRHWSGELLEADVVARVMLRPSPSLFEVHGNPFHFGGGVGSGVDVLRPPSFRDEKGVRKRHRPIGWDLWNLIDAADEALLLAHFESSKLEQRTADAHRVAAALLFVDGKVWRRCDEPFWTVRSGRDDFASIEVSFDAGTSSWDRFAADIADDARVPGDMPCADFRLDRHDEAVRFARTFHRGIRGDEVGRVEIVDAGVLVRDDAQLDPRPLRRRVAAMLPLLATAPPALLCAWAELRDLVGEAAGAGSAVGPATLDRLPPLLAYLEAEADRQPDAEEGSPGARRCRLLRMLARDGRRLLCRAAVSGWWTAQMDARDEAALAALAAA